MATFDAIVLGCGGVGSAALSQLARRGARVLGLDQFPPAHDRGSSHGQTRLIRRAYFEHPDYVPLVERAYRLWAELGERRGEQLFFETGLLQVGPPAGVVLAGVMASAHQHGLTVEQLAPAEITRRWPGFAVPESLAGVYEPGAGYLRVEQCVLAHLQDAQAAGAELRTEDPVIDVRRNANDVVVETSRGSYSAARLVITAGPWAARWLQDIGVPLVVKRKPLFWFATESPVYRADAGCPAFLHETERGVFYGFPEIEAGEIKVAEHSGGQPVADATSVDRQLVDEDRSRVADFIGEFLPAVSQKMTAHVVCMYTMSPDEHFLVDLHPADPRISFATGLSGHGFKFTPVLGEALADLALAGRTNLPIEFLGCRRPTLRS